MDIEKPRIPNDDELAALRAQIEERTDRLANSQRMQQGVLLREINAVYPTFNKNILRNLRDLQLIRPSQGVKGDYHYYTVDDLRDILLVLALQDPRGPWRIPSYSNSFGILIQSLRRQLQEVQAAAKSIEAPVSQTQVERGLYFWRGSLIRYFLLYLFGGKLPAGAYVFLFKPRRPVLDPQNGRAPWLTIKEPSEFEDVKGWVKSSKLIFVTYENGEALHWPLSVPIPQQIEQSATWYWIEGGGRNKPSDYDIILAVPNAHQKCYAPEEPAVIRCLLRLIDGCFLDESDIGYTNHQGLTTLDVVIGLIPKMSPVWQYAACLTPSAGTPDRLGIRSDSKKSAADGPQAIQIGTGQLLSGRAYKEGYPVIVQKTIDDNDPRIAEGRASGAAAVPTLYNDEANGALFVAPRIGSFPAPLFSEDDVALLRILGLIAGQLLGQDEAFAQSGRMSLAIMNDPAPTGIDWDKLPAALAEALKEVKPSDAASSKDSIHLVAVQVKTYDELEAVAPDIATWAIEQLYVSAVRYFTERHIAPPNIYSYLPHEFLLLLPKFYSSDEADRQMREELRARLNSLSLTLPTKGQQVKVECELWSLPFRYNELLRAGSDPEKQANDMITAAKEAFDFLPYVYQAHQYERDGAWAKAYEKYRAASWLAPENQYLRRHIAKALTQMQRHQEAVNLWNQILHEQEHPSHYRRLASNQVALNTEDGVRQAIESIKKAITLDNRDAKSHATAGSIYAIDGQFDKAIDELEMAAAYDPANAARYQLLIADIHYGQGHYAEAMDACITAQTHDGSDRDIPAMMMKIASARNRPTASAP